MCYRRNDVDTFLREGGAVPHGWEEAEEAHGFERESEEGSIILSHDRPIKSAF
jgi:hypothetical protein